MLWDHIQQPNEHVYKYKTCCYAKLETQSWHMSQLKDDIQQVHKERTWKMVFQKVPDDLLVWKGRHQKLETSFKGHCDLESRKEECKDYKGTWVIQ